MPMTKSAPNSFLLKAVNDAKGIIEGYASLYNIADSEGDVIAPGAFEASLRAWAQAGRQPPLLWQHDVTQPIGIWQLIKSDSTGLFVRGQLFIHEIAKAAEAYALLKRGALSGLSIGFQLVEAARDAKRGAHILRRINLFEISLVTFPALEAARVSTVKAHTPDAALVSALRALTTEIRAATPVVASTFINQEK